MPAAGVAISPWVDLSCSGASFQTNARYGFVGERHCRLAAASYLGAVDPRCPLVSPLFGELRGLPPLLLQAGGAEVLVDQIPRLRRTRGGSWRRCPPVRLRRHGARVAPDARRHTGRPTCHRRSWDVCSGARPLSDMRLCCSADIGEREMASIRALLDAAFHGDFSDDDWAHALGGTHAILEFDGTLAAHAAVVPRVLDVGTQPVRAGYVEAVAVLPSSRHRPGHRGDARARRGHRA